jgi:uncharacterized protein with NAD-binding domain and iron-sulfur cluster
MAAEAQKIAVLGGGVGSITAAYWLTSQPGWQERYQVTVYQQGWRLGGKGASGRNAAAAQRIEEHGLHIWFGFYANAFALMRAVYGQLQRAPGAPLATWDQAFRPHDYVALAEQVGDGWRPWHLLMPRRAGEPGTGSDPVTPWHMALEVIALLRRWHGQWRKVAPQRAAAPDLGASWDALLALAHALPADARDHTGNDQALLARPLERIQRELNSGGARFAAIDNDEARHLLVALNIGVTVLKGMLADSVFARGFDVINDEDLRNWLRRHGGDLELCVHSAPVRASYDLFFAYEDGDSARPSLEAGTALRAALRIGLAYRGSVMYRMQAGMGDVMFAPLYQLLAARGVRFEFFHRVEEVVPNDGAVEAIRMTVQAQVRDGAYRPLVEVKGLPCWPAAPDLSQIDAAQAALIQESGVDLESYWSEWPAVFQDAVGTPLPERTLVRGRDFDQVVFGIGAGALPLLAPGLLAASPALQAASNRLRTTATQAYQVWLGRDFGELGWTCQPDGQQPVLTGFSDPYDTWAPMDQVLPHEDWPAAYAARSVSYFCGVFPAAGLAPLSDTGFPARCAAQAKANALAQLEQRIGALWPAARNGFQWQWLVDPLQAQGPARFDRQYWRANVDPSERYVLSVPGSGAARLTSAATGLSNLYLAGDWLRTGVDAGCVEAAVMGGMQASRALSGYPETIAGDSDFQTR